MNSTGVEITAGLGGFLVLFFLALAVWFLGWDLNRRLRRLRHQEEERLAEERLQQGRSEQGRSEQGRSEPGRPGSSTGPEGDGDGDQHGAAEPDSPPSQP